MRLCQEEFEAHGVAHLVTVRHRDVVRDGFDLENAVDAVFLDLPLPWEAIPAAKKAMKSRGKSRILRTKFNDDFR